MNGKMNTDVNHIILNFVHLHLPQTLVTILNLDWELSFEFWDAIGLEKINLYHPRLTDNQA